MGVPRFSARKVHGYNSIIQPYYKAIQKEQDVPYETKKMFFWQTFWQASVLDFSHPRRLHTSWIDVKLRQGVADTIRRCPMQKKAKTFHHRGFPGDSSA